MSARVVVSCDGTLPSGMPCRGALPAHVIWPARDPWYHAYKEAKARGWNCQTKDGRDLCPACARRAVESRASV